MSTLPPIKEWEELSIGKSGQLVDRDAQRLHKLAERIKGRLKGRPAVLTRTATPGLKAGQVVGVLTTPSATVEILPKIDAEDDRSLRQSLVRMLAVARKLPIADHDLAPLEIQHENLLEVLIRIFSNRLHSAIRRGLPHRYIDHEDDLPRLKGKLNVKRQFSRNAVRPDRLACAFDEFSPDTPLNRVLKAAVVLLVAVSKSASNQRKLIESLARFDAVSDSPDPLRERVMLDRTNRTFHQLYEMTRLLLAGDWQSTTTGRVEGFSLLFPMNELFEEYIGRSLKFALPSMNVVLQQQSHHAINSPGKRFNLMPDIVVDGNVIIDTKWKRLRPESEKRHFGVEQDDIYQLLAYARAYSAKRVILLYPWHRDLDQQWAGIYQQWRTAGDSTPFDIATVDVSQPKKVVQKTLQSIVTNSESPGIAENNATLVSGSATTIRTN